MSKVVDANWATIGDICRLFVAASMNDRSKRLFAIATCLVAIGQRETIHNNDENALLPY